jgi:hypothetical protein
MWLADVEATMPTDAASQNRSLIALTDIDQVFNNSVIKELADILKIQEGAYSRLAHNIRNDARLFLVAKGRLNNPLLRTEIERLYTLNNRALRGEREAKQLARAVDGMHVDVRHWLVRCNPDGRNISTAAEILSPVTRASAIQRLRLILSYGGDFIEGRKRPTGKRSREFVVSLRTPEKTEPVNKEEKGHPAQEEKQDPAQTEATAKKKSRKRSWKGRPRGEAERNFVQNLALTYLELTGKETPDTVRLDICGPFWTFVHRCFELVGASTGNITRLINERGEARSRAATNPIPERQKHKHTYCTHPDPPPVTGDPSKWG